MFSAPRGICRPSRRRSSATCACSLPTLRLGPSGSRTLVVSVFTGSGAACPLRAFSSAWRSFWNCSCLGLRSRR